MPRRTFRRDPLLHRHYPPLHLSLSPPNPPLCSSDPQIRSSTMDTSCVLRSFQVPFSRFPLKQTSVVEGQRLVSSKANQKGSLRSCVKLSVTASALKSDVDTPDKISEGPLLKKNGRNSAFPNGFETLLLEVCDATDVAELKFKAGDFEMHLKRDVGISKASSTNVPSIVSPTSAPDVPTKPMVQAASVVPSVSPQKSPPASPFINVPSAKQSRLAALEASGSNAYVLVPSPTVGTFRKARTLKGKKQPPSCKEGDVVKEGQIICFLDQFGSELPVRSDAAGEVLKVLFNDGEAVGYGDPLIAVLPSFHGIK